MGKSSTVQKQLAKAMELLDQTVTQVGRTITSELREEIDALQAEHRQRPADSTERALFEHAFPPPDNIRWSEEHQGYGYIVRNSPNLTQVHRYRSMWRVWQQARATLVIEVERVE